MRSALVACLVLLIVAALPSMAADTQPLTLESKISLGDIEGRIDHLAVDPVRGRLYVAELGNNSVGVVDLKAGQLNATHRGFNGPQGIAFVAARDQVYVANGGDGVVAAYGAANFTPLGHVDFGDDADNLRVDTAGQRLFTGYGAGALAVVDLGSSVNNASASLPAHPEGFQLSADGKAAFINVPGAHQIAVVDLQTMRLRSAWSTEGLSANFPMALGEGPNQLWVVFRAPPRLVAFDTVTGLAKTTLESCADSDDLFVDRARHRLYVICGGGQVDVWQQHGETYLRTARVQTAPGARTGLFVPEMDRLYVAVRADPKTAAAIWVFRPGSASRPPPYGN